jgi:hypothetical protein
MYPLEKFLKDVKRLFKQKDKYLKAQERLNIPLEIFLKCKKHKIHPLEKFQKDVKQHFKRKDKYFKA